MGPSQELPKSSELPTSVLSAERQEMLENMQGADPTIGKTETPQDKLDAMSPEQREAAEGVLKDVGAPAVAESVAIDPTYVEDGTQTAEDHANNTSNSSKPNARAYNVSTHQPVPARRKVGKKNLKAINDNLANWTTPETTAEDSTETVPEIEDKPIAEVVPAELPKVETKPISTRRVLNTEKPVAANEEDQALVDQLTKGKLTNLGTRLHGAKDLRAARKHAIKTQRETLDESVSDKRGDLWNARGRRLGNWKKNNVVARVGQRSAKRQELRDKAFNAIDDLNISNPRKGLMRLQARKNAWKMAREDVRKRTTESFAKAKSDVEQSKGKLISEKDRRRTVKFRPYRRRRTYGGAGSVSYREAWRDSGADLHKSDSRRDQERKKRLEQLKKRQAQAAKAQARR